MARKRPAATLRRGFKTEAESIAREIRAELRLSSIAPLDPHALAAHLDIPTVRVSDYMQDHPEMVRFFRGKGLSIFSATTVFITSTERVIVYNDFHAATRQASDITHECAHGLLLHEPREAFAAGGCRDVDHECEHEATWLGGVLLVPNDAALHIVRNRIDYSSAAQQYGVSDDLMQWRIRMSGAEKIMARARAKWGR